jgi:DNA-binding transcriptional ArsR family regulator
MFHIVLYKTAKCPLSFEQMLVYSNLAFKDYPMSAATLAKQTGLGEREVQLLCSELGQHNLCVSDGGGTMALEPPKWDWFVPRATQEPGKWAKKFAYWVMYPTAELTTPEAAVWSFIFGRNYKTRLIPVPYLCDSLGYPLEAVQTALESLTERGLVELDELGRRTAIYDRSLGQTLEESVLLGAEKRGVVRKAKRKETIVDAVNNFTQSDVEEEEGDVLTPETNYLEWLD